MEKFNIYLGKSNLCDIDTIMRIRKFFNSNPLINLVEFKGGKYSNADLLSCDLFVIVPAKMNDESVSLGKGLTSQIIDFPNKENIIVVISVEGGEIKAKHFAKTELDDINNWAESYSKCYMQGLIVDITKDFGGNIVVPEKIAVKSLPTPEAPEF